MSYQIKFKSKEIPDITLDNLKGEKLKELWFNENKRNLPVEIEGNAYLICDIKSIIKIPYYENYNDNQIEDNKCRGQYSIQNEINHIAKEHKDWAKKIQNKKWREDTRQFLWTLSQEWCDFKKGVCNCE